MAANILSEGPTDFISELPPAIPPPFPVHERSATYNIQDLCPYALDPSLQTLELEYIVHPIHNSDANVLDISISAHFHGVSTSLGPQMRHPYITTVRESEKCTVPGVHLAQCAGVPGAHNVVCKAKLAQIPLGVTCVLLTASSARLDLIQKLEINVYTLRYALGHSMVRRQIGFSSLQASEVRGILESAKSKKGTLTLSMLVQNAGWWNLYSKHCYFHSDSVDAFRHRACMPREDGSETPLEGLLRKLPMYKALVRKISVTVDQVYQLPAPRAGLRKRLGLKGSDTYVQSRMRGCFPVENVPQDCTTALSHLPILNNRASFQQIPWVANRVLASDSRFIEITLHNSPQGQPIDPNFEYYDELDLQSDPGFLGVARFNVAQAWMLLPEGCGEYECKLRLKLGPANHRSCTGTVVVSLRVTQEPMELGVSYQTSSSQQYEK